MQFGTVGCDEGRRRSIFIIVPRFGGLDVLWLIEDLHFCWFQGERISKWVFLVSDGDAEIMARRYGCADKESWLW